MSCIVLDIELTEKNIIKDLGLYIEGSVQGFSFCPTKSFKPNKQTTWNTSHLHGIAWSSGKLDYEKLFAVFYDIRVMNAEVFAKGILLEKAKRTVRGCALVTLSDTKQGFTVPRGKQRCMEYGLCKICDICACLLYLCLLLI